MNSLRNQIRERGFTIIEVVLVLAIAGLIFLMVFIALPALQSNQRDNARKNDASAVVAGVNTYTSANRQGFPDTADLTGDSNGDPLAESSFVSSVSDNTTTVIVNNDTGAQDVTDSKVPDGTILVTQSTTCGEMSNTKAVLARGTTRQYTVVTKLEAGNGMYYCQAA